MSNHTWRLMADELPPFDTPILVYMPGNREGQRIQTGIVYKVKSANPKKDHARMTLVGFHFAHDHEPITKWMPLDELVPNPEED